MWTLAHTQSQVSTPSSIRIPLLRVFRYSELGQMLSQFMMEQYHGIDDGDCVAIAHSNCTTPDTEKLVMSCQGNHIYIGVGLVRGSGNNPLYIKFDNSDVEITASKCKETDSPLLVDTPNSAGMKELFSFLCLAAENQANHTCKSFTIRSRSASEHALMIHFKKKGVLFDVNHPDFQ